VRRSECRSERLRHRLDVTPATAERRQHARPDVVVAVSPSFPALLPAIVGSARLSYGVGWKVGIVAELFGVTTGLGYLLSYARTMFDTALLYAVTLVVVVLVVAVDVLVFSRLERYVTRHRADAAVIVVGAHAA